MVWTGIREGMGLVGSAQKISSRLKRDCRFLGSSLASLVMNTPVLKRALSLLTAVVLVGLIGFPVSPVMAHCPTKIFTASGSGSTKAEARKNAMKKIKKKVAAYKKKHPGCKVKIITI